MSQLLNEINTFETRIRKPYYDRQKIVEFSESISEPVAYCERKQYIISAEFKKVCYCDTKDIGYMRELFCKNLKEKIYGDFKESVYELAMLIHEEDMEKSKEIINRIIEEIK